MDLRAADDSESRFAAYVEGLVSVIGHADRAGPLRDYCVGLMMPCERKSVEPMAAVTAPARTAAQHQSLLHFVGEAAWSDEKVLAKVREMVLPEIERHGPIEAWIIDDTGFPKQGRHSVGVARQYCGQLGKQDNCQVAVSLSIANHHASLPVAYRLYLPQEWAEDANAGARRACPRRSASRPSRRSRLSRCAAACEAGLPRGVVLMDAGYGSNTELRAGIARWGCAMSPASCRTPRCGRRARGRCRRKSGRAAAGRRSCCAATQASADLGQGTGAWSAQAGLAHDHMARRRGRAAVLALCPRARACRASRLQSHRRAGRKNGC